MSEVLTAEQVTRFERNGFINGGPLLDVAQTAEMLAELMRIIEIGPKGFAEGQRQPVLFRDLTGSTEAVDGRKKAPVWQIVNIWEASPLFEQLIYHPGIVGAISQLTGMGDLQVWHDQVQYKPANAGGATTWHQDAPLWPSIEPMTPVSAWIPFADALPENGCMWMVPGSHKWGNQQAYLNTRTDLKLLEEFDRIGEGFEMPEIDGGSGVKGAGCDCGGDNCGEMTEVKPVLCPVRAGEVHFHHSLTWHGSPENHSPNPRPGLAIHYMTSDARYTGRAHPMSVHIQVQTGERMIDAGPHFPKVCQGGKPVAGPGKVTRSV